MEPRTEDGLRPAVYIARDRVLDASFAQLASRLESEGLNVVRGSEPELGRATSDLANDIEQLRGADVMVPGRAYVSRTLIESCVLRLRGIVTPTIGVETIDLEAATDYGILVANGAVPEAHQGMAESAVMLLLNLFFRFRRTEQNACAGVRPAPDAVDATRLGNKTIGIIGLGNIGRGVATLLLSFGSQVLAFSPKAHTSSTPPGVSLTTLEDIATRCDALVICAAMTPEKRHMINAQVLAKMKASAFVVNIARGDAIYEPALVDALRARQIAGAALDTTAVEPLPMDSPLRALDNVILTGHAVGYTRDLLAAVKEATVRSIIDLLRGEIPAFCKNPVAGDLWTRRIFAMDRMAATKTFIRREERARSAPQQPRIIMTEERP